jgi:hypothetical protein
MTVLRTKPSAAGPVLPQHIVLLTPELGGRARPRLTAGARVNAEDVVG